MAKIRIMLSMVCASNLLGCSYDYHEEIVDATRDAEMTAWLEKHNLRIANSSDNWDRTAIYFQKRKEKK